MGKTLLSVGLDVGTTTSQMIVSELTVENRAGSFSVPEMAITGKKIRYRGKVHFTPLVENDLVDSAALRSLVEEDYRLAGICREQVDTGAIIITGETSRKENADIVLNALSDLAGDFVVATAGPDLESVLAAKGAGADAVSLETHRPVLHMDIGGGTSNLALIEKGKIIRTGCLNVGGRLLKLNNGVITYLSPVLMGLTHLKVGDTPSLEQLDTVAETLTQGLEMAAGLRPATDLLAKLMTKEATNVWTPPADAIISFSGGVADCIDTGHPPFAFGDIGPLLGQKIKKSLLCRGHYVLGKETIRATVIGAGCHSATLSGSTVFYRNVTLPIKNLPVACFTGEEQTSPHFSRLIARRLQEKDEDTVALAFPGFVSPSYGEISRLADDIVSGTTGKSVFVCLQADMAKALGHALSLRLPKCAPCLCIDSVSLSPESFLDIGAPVGPCLPVVIKTLVLENRRTI